jgi:hypothetical protein
MNNLYGRLESCRILTAGRRIDLIGDEHGNLTVEEGGVILWQQTVWTPGVDENSVNGS